jgi:hypothetical protein
MGGGVFLARNARQQPHWDLRALGLSRCYVIRGRGAPPFSPLQPAGFPCEARLPSGNHLLACLPRRDGPDAPGHHREALAPAGASAFL